MSPPTNRPVTGGIRKSLLTPARRIGLSRKVPTPDNIASLLTPKTDTVKTPNPATTNVAPKVSQKTTTGKSSVGRAPIRIGLSKKVRTPSNVNKVLDILSSSTVEPPKQELHAPNKVNDITSRNVKDSSEQEVVSNSISKGDTPNIGNLLKPVKRLGLSRKVRTPDNLNKLINSPILTSVQKSPVTPKLNKRTDKSTKRVENKKQPTKNEDSTFTESEISNKSSGLLEPTTLTPRIQKLKFDGSEISSAPKLSENPLVDTGSSTPLTHKTKSFSTDIRVRQNASQQETPVTHIEGKRSRNSLKVAGQENSDQSQGSDDDFVVKRCRKKLKIFDSDVSEKSCDLGEVKKTKAVPPQIPSAGKKAKTSIRQKVLCKSKIDDSDSSSDDEPLSRSVAKRKTEIKDTTRQCEVVDGLNKETKQEEQSEDDFASSCRNEPAAIGKTKIKSEVVKLKQFSSKKHDDDSSSTDEPLATNSKKRKAQMKSKTKQSEVVDGPNQNLTTKEYEVVDRSQEKSSTKAKRSEDDFDSSSDDEPLVVKRRTQKISARNKTEVVDRVKQSKQCEVVARFKCMAKPKQSQIENTCNTGIIEFVTKSEVSDTKQFEVESPSFNETVTKQWDLSNKENNNIENVINAVSPNTPLASSMYRIPSKTQPNKLLQRQPSTKSAGRLSLKKSMSSTSFATDTDDEFTIKPKKSLKSNEGNDEFMKECFVDIQGMSNLRVNSFSDANTELQDLPINEILAVEDEGTHSIITNQEFTSHLKTKDQQAVEDEGTTNSRTSSQEFSSQLKAQDERGTPKSQNISATPNSKSCSQDDNLEAQRHEALELHFRVLEKEARLADLQRAESTKKKHNVQELEKLTSTWKTGCQNALCELLKKLQENGTFTMESLLGKLNTTSDFVGYDSDKGVFS